MTKNINIKTLQKLYQVFEDKQWKINQSEEDSLFNRLSKTLRLLDAGEQDLFISLLKKLDYYTVSDYENLLIDALGKMKQDIGNKKFKFAPLISNRNEKDIKSSMLVAYLLKSNTIQYNSNISKMKICLTMDLTETEVSKLNRSEMYLVLIDDFIGTGDSAIEAVKYFTNKNVKKSKIIILSLITLTAGASKIESEGIKHFYAKKSQNLAEQFYSLSNLNELEANIISLSKKVGVKESLYLGFKGSGALLSMIRMPNNTIGVFFDGKGSANIPFPRFFQKE